ncbi:family 20 glycosylhydrolase [Dokdonella sp.]|uniref:beta-N-acetylhexosaminidase n=1 Tax=Dokdonella sp. TaxID=2291710 RepID=UPI001B015DAA|nr:family 20 glycosylhydrolase [Dokdonella sp.]MBO9661880.1 family 20 glycosylhydrolase [Dokdonella sp.]
MRLIATGTRRLAAAVLWLALCGGCAKQATVAPDAKAALPLLPVPAEVERRPGHFLVRDGMPLRVDARDAEVAGIARRFTDRLAGTRGLRLTVQPSEDTSAATGAIAFRLDAQAPAGEGYAVDVDAQHVVVRAREPRGLFYGGVTLWQLLTADLAATKAIELPALRIVDAPRFAWRGAMLDSARHYQPPEFVERFIDQLALLKLNTFHWHLTDDQGWRIEIKRYPKLTEIGAWRRPAGAAGTDANGQPVRYGGYYTQEQIRRIVRYAAERNVTIVPEIDVPGHMQAAIAAYPELGSAGDTPVVSPDWGVHSYLLNVDESTLAFMRNVFDEVIELFPGRYIHIGGDEAVKDQWQASPRVQARRRALGIADEAGLQGWFVARLQDHLAARGRRLIGWDEILEGGLPAEATVMSWRGAQGGVEAAHAGHDVVMSPSPDLYLNHLQSDAADEPGGRFEVRSLADVYAYDPLPGTLDAEAARHVLGAQGNLWTEHLRTPARVEHAAFPRLAALAEVLWSPPATHDWSAFLARLVPQMRRWHALGVDAAASAFEVRMAEPVATKAGVVDVALSSQSGLPIRYAQDGRDPRADSPLYRDPLQLPSRGELRAAVFLGTQRAGPVRRFELAPADLLRRGSDRLKQCSGKLTLRLEDDAPREGERAFFDVDLFDPCWIWPDAPLAGIGRVEAVVGQLPYNFQLWNDVRNIVPRPAPMSPSGELLIKLGGCDGAVWAALPLAAAASNPALSTLSAALPPRSGKADLCFQFSGEGHDPLWAIDEIHLVPDSPSTM